LVAREVILLNQSAADQVHRAKQFLGRVPTDVAGVVLSEPHGVQSSFRTSLVLLNLGGHIRG